MVSFLISDNEDMLLGMKLAGIEGEFMTDDEEIIKKIDELIQDKNVGIILLSHHIKERLEEAIMSRKLKSRETLIVEIPGPNETVQSDFITKYIRESIGLKL